MKFIIGKEALKEEFNSIPIEKSVSAMGAFYYPGKSLTVAHTINLIKMKLLFDITILVLYWHNPSALTAEQTDTLIQDFMERHSDTLVDYLYVDKDMFMCPSKYDSLEVPPMYDKISASEEWQWYKQNTELEELFQHYNSDKTYIDPMFTICLFPRETNRIKISYEGLSYALGNRGVSWIRGINDAPSDIKYVWGVKYPNLIGHSLHQVYLNAVSSGLMKNRTYFPLVKYPSGRAARNSNQLTDKISNHIFNELITFDYTKLTISDLETFVSSRIPTGNGFCIFNIEGKQATDNDLINRRVFLCVYGFSNQPENIVYEPFGEITLVGMNDNEIMILDHQNNNEVIFKKDERLSLPNSIITDTYYTKCSEKTSILETATILNSDLKSVYSSLFQVG